jgi:hypothetical protein
MRLCKLLMLICLSTAELAICSLISLYLSANDLTCDEVGYALIASALAQCAHIFIAALSIRTWSSMKYLAMVIIVGSWLAIFGVFVILAVLLSEAEACKTTQDFNIAFALIFAELLCSFTFTCCSFCTPDTKLVERLDVVVSPKLMKGPDEVEFEFQDATKQSPTS